MELYIHIPFCRQKCRYCDFPSWPGRESLMPRYIDALLTEAERQSGLLNHPEIETVFIGGGTPSLIPPELLEKLLIGLHSCFSIREDAEWTCEANPGTLTQEWLQTARKSGVNRLSMGMQAAQPGLLHLLGRIHTMEQVDAGVRMARDCGFDNINLDLMFGLPTQTEADWMETLNAALELKPKHLSCYGLIVEDGTPIAAEIEKGTLRLPEEDTERRMYDTAIELLKAHGLKQYEISNFALPGRECRHNLGYWRQIPYLGLGASAASMLPDPEGKLFCVRSANPKDITEYMRMAEEGQSTPDREPVTFSDAHFETMMLGLRTTDGVSEDDFMKMHGVSLNECYGKKLESLASRKLLEHKQGRWFLTRRGMDIQNSILVELMDD